MKINRNIKKQIAAIKSAMNNGEISPESGDAQLKKVIDEYNECRMYLNTRYLAMEAKYRMSMISSLTY